MNSNQAKIGPVLKQMFASLLYPQVVLLIFLPFLVSILLVGLGFWFSWEFLISFFYNSVSKVQPYLQELLQNSPSFLEWTLSFFKMILPWLLFLILFALSYPLIVALNLMIVSVLASTYLVKFIARHDYKNLEMKGRSRFVNGIYNTFSSTILFLFFWVITLPLWLIPFAAFVLPLLLTAWLNRRVCTFDALTDFATDAELGAQKEMTKKTGFVLGVVTAGFNYIPFAFLISPVLTMVGFIHLNLMSLSLQRTSKN